MNTQFMRQAIQLAVENIKNGGGPFGAVIVKDGKVIATGVNRVTANNDPTAHAEVSAIREACAKIGNFKLEGCVCYTSCEPCPMCLMACKWANLDKIYLIVTIISAMLNTIITAIFILFLTMQLFGKINDFCLYNNSPKR